MSSRTSSNANEASISLKFIVVGGGISGLSTAYTLRKAGHSVVVLEKRDATSATFSMGGVIAPPNMTKLLYRWGLGPVLNEKGTKCNQIVYINGHCGDQLGTIVLNEEFFGVLMADMIILQHGDLVNILYDQAVQEGVDIRRNANVIHTDPDYVSVRLDTGETISGDIIVVADGFTSSLRPTVIGYPEKTSLESGEKMLMVTFTAETSLLRDDESLKPLLDSSVNWKTWMAEDTVMHMNILNGEEHIVGVLMRNYIGPSTEGDDEWSNSRSLESYGLDFIALEPRMQKILKISNTLSSRTFLRRPFLEEFVNDRSSMVLVGEAAHPFVCDGFHTAALGVEDAETLGSLFSRIQCREQVKQLLTAYEEIRHPRYEELCQFNQRLEEVMKCPVGPEQEMRDALLRQTLAYGGWDHMDESTFRDVWGPQLATFSYDANEAVDDWWGQWGSFISHGENVQSNSALAGLEVWISNQ